VTPSWPFEHQREPHLLPSGRPPYDSPMERPSPQEVRRAVVALVLGLALGLVLLLLARRRAGGA